MFKYIYNSVKRNMAAGLVVIIPIVLTVLVIRVFWTALDTPLRAVFIPPEPGSTGMLPTIARFICKHIGDLSFMAKPGAGIALVIITLFLIGLLTRTLVGKYFVGIGDHILGRIPVIRTLYISTKQLLSALLGDGEASFREAVLVEYPKKDCYVVGFLASQGKGELAEINMEPVVNVFVPTTPNPTSGFLLLVPESRVKRLHMSIEDAVKFIISSGIVADPTKQKKPTLFETPTRKVDIEPPAHAVHPDIRKLTDAVKKEDPFTEDASDPDE